MREEKDLLTFYPVWIDQEKQIISFKEADGFEEIRFATHKEMITFVIEKVLKGYRIQ